MWTPEEFQRHHNHHLGIAQARHAAHIANAIMRQGEPEGIAIATANKLVEHHRGIAPQHRDDGGSIQGGPTGIMPNQASAQLSGNPIMSGWMQQLGSLSTEQLHEYAARFGSSQVGQIARALLTKRTMMPNVGQKLASLPQATLAPATPQATTAPADQDASAPSATGQRFGGSVRRRQTGGPLGVPMSQADPWWARREAGAETRSGFLAGRSGGRADLVHTSARPGSYVLPADVVSSLGQGNSLAGATVWQRMIDSGPFGTGMPRPRRGMGPPRPPRPEETQGAGYTGNARGGLVPQTPVALSDGEIVISPEEVRAIGGGDLTRGHRILDKFVLLQRKRHIHTLKKLPPPVKDRPHA